MIADAIFVQKMAQAATASVELSLRRARFALTLVKSLPSRHEPAVRFKRTI
jgi:hypothetical protein